jgi:hypothetical protein
VCRLEAQMGLPAEKSFNTLEIVPTERYFAWGCFEVFCYRIAPAFRGPEKSSKLSSLAGVAMLELVLHAGDHIWPDKMRL